MNALKVVLLSTTVLVVFLIVACESDENTPAKENPIDTPYEITVDPADFESTAIGGNQFFPLTAGTTFVYEGEDEDGKAVRVEEIHTGDTKVIMGVTCAVVNAREFIEGELEEDTFDWYAQDKDGNVWYFGEDSREIKNGEVVSTEGSWESGVDGALPGIIMFADPVVGVWYRQEFYENEAEDVGQIISLSETVTVPYGTYNNCLVIKEYNPLERGIVEHKIYAPGVGLLRAIAVEGETGFEDLTQITPNQ